MHPLAVFPEPLNREDPQEVLAAFKQHAPVDVVSAANALGIHVYQKQLSPNVSGILKREPPPWGGPSGFVIFVEDSHPPNRQRFTVAHEIGHFVLHRQKAEMDGGIQDDEFYRALSGPLERQANQFAADLLMPWPLVRQLQAQGVVALPDLARRLQVSRQALAIRLGIPYDQDWA